MNDNDCIFCKIIRKEIPSTVLYEDELVMAFMDVMPVNPGHVLIIPKEHQQYVSDVSPEAASRMFEVARKINTATRKSGLKCDDINFMVSDGPAASQEVAHCHLHSIPRYEGDGVKFVFPGKADGMAAIEDLKEAADKIKSNLKGL
ncbi:MAG: HIT family protein [Spirochaetales bacterium]|nr:HIT family protein [Spirochaetales bacterium]